MMEAGCVITRPLETSHVTLSTWTWPIPGDKAGKAHTRTATTTSTLRWMGSTYLIAAELSPETTRCLPLEYRTVLRTQFNTVASSWVADWQYRDWYVYTYQLRWWPVRPERDDSTVCQRCTCSEITTISITCDTWTLQYTTNIERRNLRRRCMLSAWYLILW